MSSNLYSTCKENINSRMFQRWWPLPSLLISSVFHSLLFLLHLHLQNMKNVLHLFPPEVFCSIYTLLCGGKLRGFLMFFHLKRLNFQRLFSNRCHLLNSYVSLLILTFLSSVLQWKGNQNKALWTVWSIYCTFLSFLCSGSILVFKQGGDDNTKRAFLVSSSTIARNLKSWYVFCSTQVLFVGH